MRRSGFGSAVQSALWLFWGGLALILCWLVPWLAPSESDEMGIYLFGLIVWAALTCAVLCYVLFWARTQLHVDEDEIPDNLRIEHMNRRIITLGLVGGFSIAIPALAFTIIGFVAMVPHFNRGFSEESTLTLPNGAQLQVSKDTKSSYIVAVDVSRSNLSSSVNQQPVDQICNAVHALFAKKDGMQIVRSRDSFGAIVFAGEGNPMISREDPYNKDAMRSTFCDTLKERLKTDHEKRDLSNFETFFDDLEGWATEDATTHQSVTIFIFSDFMHEPRPGNSEDIEKTVERFMTRIRTLRKVSMAGFPMRSVGWKRPPEAIDILPSLENNGMGWESQARIWQEIPMPQFDGADPDAWRELFLLSSYREILHPEPLHLGYKIAPSWKAVSATVTVPKDADHNLLYIGIRPSRKSAGPVAVRFEDGIGPPFKLTSGDNAQPKLQRYDRRNDSFKLALEEEVEVSPSAECDLKIVNPELRIVHSIKLVMHPVFGKLAGDAIRSTLVFLSIVVALLALRASGIPEALERRKARNGKGPRLES